MRYIPFLICLLLLKEAFPQDILILKDGNEIQSKILEISPIEIKYKRFDNLDGPLISILKTDVFMIKYQNGTKDVIQSQPIVVKATTPENKDSSDSYYYTKGGNDGEQYFSATGASAGTFAATVLATPIGGLVTAIATSSTTPKPTNFVNTNQKLLDNSYYVRGYQQAAKKKKQRAVWSAFAFGVFIDIILITAFATM